jgi:hypothetical protein
MGADAEEMINKFNMTFGDFAGGTEDVLDDFFDATGRNRYELMGLAADLGTVMKGMDLTGSQASILSADFAQFAVDVGSFNNMKSTDVANRFRAALSGEYGSLKALGWERVCGCGTGDVVNETPRSLRWL